MTRKELSEIINISESTLRTNFNRTKERFLDLGILISKEGRGDNTEYFLEDYYEGSLEKFFQKKYKKCRDSRGSD